VLQWSLCTLFPHDGVLRNYTCRGKHVHEENRMTRSSDHTWLMAMAFGVIVVGVTVKLTSPVFADEGGVVGCLSEQFHCTEEQDGFCEGLPNPDRCSCINPHTGHETGTCECSTKKFPPCDKVENP
jgi:hypothetical protein